MDCRQLCAADASHASPSTVRYIPACGPGGLQTTLEEASIQLELWLRPTSVAGQEQHGSCTGFKASGSAYTIVPQPSPRRLRQEEQAQGLHYSRDATHAQHPPATHAQVPACKGYEEGQRWPTLHQSAVEKLQRSQVVATLGTEPGDALTSADMPQEPCVCSALHSRVVCAASDLILTWHAHVMPAHNLSHSSSLTQQAQATDQAAAVPPPGARKASKGVVRQVGAELAEGDHEHVADHQGRPHI